jgi:hypothetical protein
MNLPTLAQRYLLAIAHAFDTSIFGDYEFCPLFKWPRQ